MKATPRRVSSWWTLLPWIVPMRFLPRAWAENVERAVYDGFTRHEWFEEQVRQLHEAQRNSNETI